MAAPGYPAPYGYPAPPPARPGRPAAFWLLLGLSILLAVGLVSTVVLGVGAIHSARQERATLTAQRDTRTRQDATAKAKLQDDFRAADLPGKLQQVKDLDKATDTAFAQWDSGSTTYGTLGKAITACELAVEAYDKVAGAFPASMLTGGLPQKVNTDNPETDCGRAFVNRI